MNTQIVIQQVCVELGCCIPKQLLGDAHAARPRSISYIVKSSGQHGPREQMLPCPYVEKALKTSGDLQKVTIG